MGGLGLNLTGADTVIFLEHDWNPTKDLQAMDRWVDYMRLGNYAIQPARAAEHLGEKKLFFNGLYIS